MTDSEPRSLRDSVDDVVRSLRGTGARSLAGVFGRWEEAVGPQIAAHARPASLTDGRLVVDVDHPTWATQLRFLESDLLAAPPGRGRGRRGDQHRAPRPPTAVSR